MPAARRNRAPSTPVTETGRICTKCGLFKEWSEYHNTTTGGYKGKHVACKLCINADSSRRQPARKAALKKSDPYKHRSRRLRNGLLDRARASGNKQMYDMTPSAIEIEAWLRSTPLVCYYSGTPVTIATMHVDHKQPVNRGGMNTLDNLCIASAHMNTAKGSMTEQEFKALLMLVSSWEDKGVALLRRLRQGRF